MIRVLLIHGHQSHTLVADLTGQMEVDLVQAATLQAGQVQAGKVLFDIILAPASGCSGTSEPEYSSALINWNQEVRNTGAITTFLLYASAGSALVVTDISAGMVSIKPDEGATRTLFTIFRQAASRSRLERSFRTEYDLQSRVIALMPLAYLCIDSGRIVGTNPAFERLSERSGESLLGRSLSDLLTIEPDSPPLYQATLHTRPEEDIPVRVYRPGMEDLTGSDTGLLFVEDRREIEQLTADLRETERSCREKLWLSETLVLKLAPDGMITFANNATLRCFGYTDQGLSGHHISLLLPQGLGPEPASVSLFLGVANESEPTAIHIMEHLRSDGGKIYIAWTTKAYYSTTGELTGLICIGTDMTEQTPEGEGRISTRIWRERVIEGTDILPEVFDAILQACVEIAREGREGKPIGTSFLVGDREEVMDRSRQLILNPFHGHPPEMRMVTKKDVREMLKEYALLDGAFVVSGDGMLEAAGRYITVDASYASLPKGMGTRHSSTAAITSVTRAVGLVVSESGGRVSVIKDGKIVKVIG